MTGQADDLSADLAELVEYPLLHRIKSQLELRDPNYDALEVLAALYSCHVKAESTETLEGVIESAVGVGKTYVMAAAIDYFSQAHQTRNFVIVTPSTVINDKTIANFTPGSPKSLVGNMTTKLEVITSDNFNTSNIKAKLEDTSQTKLFIFTVQSLLTPKGKNQKRRTHSFQEALGTALYQYLQEAEDMILFADENHLYNAPAFSTAVREIAPSFHVGLTGTPHPDNEDRVVFRYPLAAAIADGYVKKPVIVGRTDERKDEITRINDGLTLLEKKQEDVDNYIERHSKQRKVDQVNPIMLILCPDIEEAKRISEMVESSRIMAGEFRGKVLQVHSKTTKVEDTLRTLAEVENPKSPIRVVVAVNKLKEGWDVKNVYVLLSLRASISETLTEQTLGRGLRLPFGKRTGLEILDTLEVIAHEKYDDLFARKGLIGQGLSKQKTRMIIVKDRAGNEQVRVEDVPISMIDETEDTLFGIETIDERTVEMVSARFPIKDNYKLPLLQLKSIKDTWSLAQITNSGLFRELGRQIALNPEGELRRTVIDASWVEGKIIFTTRKAADTFNAYQEELPIEDTRTKMRVYIAECSGIITRREDELKLLDGIIGWFIDGVGDDADYVLASHWKYAARRISEQINYQYYEAKRKPHTEFDVIFSKEFPAKDGIQPCTNNKDRPLRIQERKRLGYSSWEKSLYKQISFDSDSERRTALILDSSKLVDMWLRVELSDPMRIRSGGVNYVPDFVVHERCGTPKAENWIVEVKGEDRIMSDEVAAKTEGAKIWCNQVNAKQEFGKWAYLLTGTDEIQKAERSNHPWKMLKSLNRA